MRAAPLILKITGTTTGVLLGLIFVASAVAKVWPFIEGFEMILVDTHIVGWTGAAILARLLIGMEWTLGFAMLIAYKPRITMLLAIILLTIFTLFLSIDLFVRGNQGNCGCFGEILPMTTRTAIIKNVILLVMAIFAWRTSAGWELKRMKWTSLPLMCIGLVLPFVINQVELGNSIAIEQFDEKGQQLPLYLLYNNEDTAKVPLPSVDLRKGKHVLAMLSLTCHHCIRAAKKMRVMHDRNPAIPFYFLINGDKEDLPYFKRQTGFHGEIPSSFCLGRTFVVLSKAHLPAIYYINNGVAEEKADYLIMSESRLENWLEKK